MNQTAKILAFVTMFSACAPAPGAVKIEYEQLGNFYCYSRDAEGVSPVIAACAAEGVFVLYRITAIDNTGEEAEDFTFEQSNVFALSTLEPSNESTDHDAFMLRESHLEFVKVEAGTTRTELGCFIKRVRTNDPQADLAKYFGLSYREEDREVVLEPKPTSIIYDETADGPTIKHVCDQP